MFSTYPGILKPNAISLSKLYLYFPFLIKLDCCTDQFYDLLLKILPLLVMIIISYYKLLVLLFSSFMLSMTII